LVGAHRGGGAPEDAVEPAEAVVVSGGREGPAAGLTLAGSTLFGTTKGGGPSEIGTVFSVPITGGAITTLANFNGPNGSSPDAGLTLSGNTLFGTTSGGGANTFNGTVFSLVIPNAVGACCAGATCTVVNQTSCAGTFRGAGSACNFPSNPVTCCKANYDGMNGVTVQDIFDFLNGWFAGDAQADINGGGITVQDIFDFLNLWFAGCA
jgi:uncharacterized repeat protein (TIGR03803 family)